MDHQDKPYGFKNYFSQEELIYRRQSWGTPKKTTYRVLSVEEIKNNILSIIKKNEARPNSKRLWEHLIKKINRYLYQVWRQNSHGIPNPRAFGVVKCGLGETMTGEDILEDTFIVQVFLRNVTPGEVITTLTFVRKTIT